MVVVEHVRLATECVTWWKVPFRDYGDPTPYNLNLEGVLLSNI